MYAWPNRIWKYEWEFISIFQIKFGTKIQILSEKEHRIMYTIKNRTNIKDNSIIYKVDLLLLFYSQITVALSFYVTKTVLVGPKLFWSDQIDLDLTIMIWSRSKWIGLVLIVIFYQNEPQFGPDQFILVMTISFWSWPNHYGQVQINLVRPKPFWTDENCFGHIEGQGMFVSRALK